MEELLKELRSMNQKLDKIVNLLEPGENKFDVSVLEKEDVTQVVENTKRVVEEVEATVEEEVTVEDVEDVEATVEEKEDFFNETENTTSEDTTVEIEEEVTEEKPQEEPQEDGDFWD